jgi:putative ABC transport system ATP-binding protein
VDKNPAVVVKGVIKTFYQGGETLHVLKDIHFHANEGEVVMIVGPSGSGKTTLLSAIAGTLSVDSGLIRLFDFELTGKSPQEITSFRREKMGFIFQQFHLIPTISCGENVAIPLLLKGVSYAEALQRAHLSLAELGLQDKVDVSPKMLSGGQQQRVAIARALIHEPSIIICDEPTASLDADSGHKILEIIARHVKKPGRVVIIVTHDSRIFHYADRLERMNDGQIIKGEVSKL